MPDVKRGAISTLEGCNLGQSFVPMRRCAEQMHPLQLHWQLRKIIISPVNASTYGLCESDVGLCTVIQTCHNISWFGDTCGICSIIGHSACATSGCRGESTLETLLADCPTLMMHFNLKLKWESFVCKGIFSLCSSDSSGQQSCMAYFTLLVYVDPVVPVTFQPWFLLVGDEHEQTHTHRETRACRITVRTVQPFPVSCQRCVKDMCLMQRSSQAWDWWTLVCRNHLRHLRLVDSGWCIWCMRGTERSRDACDFRPFQAVQSSQSWQFPVAPVADMLQTGGRHNCSLGDSKRMGLRWTKCVETHISTDTCRYV